MNQAIQLVTSALTLAAVFGSLMIAIRLRRAALRVFEAQRQLNNLLSQRVGELERKARDAERKEAAL